MQKKNWQFLGILVLIGITFLASGCDPAVTASNGKVTVSLTNHGGGADDYLYAYVYASGETDTDPPENVIAFKSEQIVGGTASFILEEAALGGGYVVASGTQWIGSGGTSYDLYVYTDTVDNQPSVQDNLETEQKTDPFPISITIDGDQTVEIDYTDMVEYIP